MLPIPRPFVISRFHDKTYFSFPQTRTWSPFSKVPIINVPGIKQLNTVMKGYVSVVCLPGTVSWRVNGLARHLSSRGYYRDRVRFIIVVSPLLNGSCCGESGPRGLNSFPDIMIKTPVNKTKWNGLLARTQAISILTIYNNDHDGKSRRNQLKQLIILTQSPF